MISSTIKCCYNCPDRVVGCHGTCEKYLTEKTEYEQRKAEFNKYREAKQYSYQLVGKSLSDRAKRQRDYNNYRRRGRQR